ncbi:hypothetical protein [Salinadaptatus halalkaliphilus]|uniref:hypothetical protein n=1 Tax=Salinadaptatus halalkaliphilus TaxID=2419781 RepID=UPI0015804B96|nr:hypothetical protein [Salinadaptatus halalkaliphilus]
MIGADPDSSGVAVLVDTDMPAAREWAESVSATYKSDAQPIDPRQIEASEAPS